MQQHISLIFILSPLIKFLCSPGRRWNKKNKSIGRILSYLFISFLIFYKLTKREKNCFQLLNVTPFTPYDVIRKSFKTVAFNLHPDRNKSEDASVKYSNLVEKYKHISTPESHYRYTRFSDLVKPELGSINEMGFMDLITLALLKSFMTVGATILILLLSNEKIIWHPLLVYQLFMLFFDIYLRLSDELFFTTKLPFFKYYVTFEILQLFNEFKSYFMHSSILFPDNSRTPTAIGSNLLINNLALLSKLDALLNKLKRMLGPYGEEIDDDDEKVVPDEHVVEVNKTIKRKYGENYFLDWSKEAKLKYKKLALHGEKLTSEEGANVFSFLFTSGIILLSFMK
ncbi:uncharacterized protein TOT_020001048 [Theileria orientalis strain Shintoku]|uniref:J domain-containing protein n=1 Tax=Theileria orientalis strain Shintoku TaxID=869250 RepID=J4C398_THEOR|nr:uncharacterized protein TOT_020001048 [Theileria orientalis strain Shintoku]BAM40066.1 uncharacterized protein TOT_020001048 [Theileria orientalis strain Shintoku]|eukprot:XP_009690367.1 uncharacterized protein TOT_020001048 [Theileria orientalis strain Shintoku]